MKIIFDCEEDCFLKLNEDFFELFCGKQTIIETNNEKCFVQVYFNSADNLPYFFSLKFDKNVTTNNKNIDIFKINDNCFYVNLKQNLVRQKQSLAFLSTQFNDYEVLQQSLLCVNASNKPIYESNDFFYKAKLYEKFGLVVCELTGLNLNKLLIFDSQNNLVLEQFFNEIEWQTDSFLIIEKLFDIHKHGVVKKFTVTENDLTLTQKYSVYLNQTPKPLMNKSCFKIAFFECLKAQNLKLAKTYLTQSLKEKITAEHIESYFGSFDKILDTHNLFENTITLLYASGTAKTFKLEVIAGLIDNIKQIY